MYTIILFYSKTCSVYLNDLLSGGPDWGEGDCGPSEGRQGLLLPGQHTGVGAGLPGQGSSSQSKGNYKISIGHRFQR